MALSEDAADAINAARQSGIGRYDPVSLTLLLTLLLNTGVVRAWQRGPRDALTSLGTSQVSVNVQC